jgi:hypothetical protein
MISLLKEAYLSLFNELLRSYGHRPELVVIGSDSKHRIYAPTRSRC